MRLGDREDERNRVPTLESPSAVIGTISGSVRAKIVLQCVTISSWDTVPIRASHLSAGVSLR